MSKKLRAYSLLLLLSFSPGAFALDLMAIVNECARLEATGNPLAVKQYLKTINGKRVRIVGKLLEIYEAPLWLDSIAHFYARQALIYVPASMPDDLLIKLVVGSTYEFEATISEYGGWGWNVGSTCPRSVSVKKVSFK